SRQRVTMASSSRTQPWHAHPCGQFQLFRLQASCTVVGKDELGGTCVAFALAQCRGSNQRWPAVCVGMVGLWLAARAPMAAYAQSGYPDRPVRVIVPYGPGGVADVTMRIIAQRLSEKLGQQFVVENRPGAGGIVAAQAGISAPPDGYTLSLTGNYNAIS